MNAPAGLMAPSLRRRMACWLYEALLLFAVALIATLVFSVAVQMRHALERQWLLQLFLVAVFGLYCSWFWSRGQTLAMKTWRIAIVDREGRRLTQGRALLRYVYCAIWVMPPLAALVSRRFTVTEVAVVFFGWVLLWAMLSRFHPQRQFWHDAWAGTRLVEAA
ncbi:RDD family protein [Ramlibacter sp.]|uniref:RDD family protein n=1 Tax=Ramlibacter sp. TaxID=1917967 RepID=UPI00262A6FA3|nr:RDD family protein [Ramlibacter sp.]